MRNLNCHNVHHWVWNILILLLPGISAYAQVDTLKVVNVESIEPLTAEVGTKLEFLDSTVLSNSVNSNLAELLAQNTPAYFRNYGVTGLASISLRGTGPNHTALLWNGIKLQTPSLQQTDYAILPSIFWDEIGVQFGPSISLTGADVSGGAIHLINRQPQKETSVRYTSQIGSFGYQQQALSLGLGKGKFRSKTQANYTTAQNDFPYEYNGRGVKQQNAALEQHNLMQHFYFQTNKIRTKAIFWYGNNDRQVPRTISSNQTDDQDSEQQDKFYRLFTSIEGGNNFHWEVNYSYQHDELVFNENENNSDQHIVRAQIDYAINQTISVDGGIQNTIFDVETSNYNVENQFRADYYIKGVAKFYGWSTHLGAKQIIIENQNAPFIPSAGISKTLIKNSSLKSSVSGKVARHFRFPTFNDLFWVPGGNPLLNPENGWSAESTLSIVVPGDIALSGEITYFNLNVENWILWRPTGEGYWAPQNLWKVRSDGIESSFKSLFKINKLPIECNVNYAFTRSINKISGDNQLIYVPRHQGSIILRAFRNHWFWSASTNYTGKVYTTQDNRESDALTGFLLQNIALGYTFQLNNSSLRFQTEINNLFNSDYQTFRNRAMPGRNYRAQLLFTFNSPSKQL